MNWIWFGLMVVAVIVAAVRGTAGEVTQGAIDSAKTAVEISIGLIGVMALWLGLMKIAEQAGLVSGFARIISPVTKWLFPGVPADHPAMGSTVMNLAANVLGLSNAATPLGIRAMEDLQSINPDKETASDGMVMLLALNTSSVQLVPATVIAVLAASGSREPTVIIGTTLVATTISTIVAIIATKLLRPLFPYGDVVTPDGEVVTPVVEEER